MKVPVYCGLLRTYGLAEGETDVILARVSEATTLLFVYQPSNNLNFVNAATLRMGSISTKNDPRGVTEIVVEIVILCFATVILAARFWARILKKKAFALNDYAVAVGWVTAPLLLFS